jgi:hypothetical protein
MPGFSFVPVAGFPPTEGLRTRGEILLDLLDYTGGGDREEAKARARRALAETIRVFNGMAWRFNRRYQDISLVADTSEYTLETTIRSVWKVMLLDSSSYLAGDLEFTAYEDFLRYDGDTLSTVNIPDEYTLYNVWNEGKIRLLPRIGAGPFTDHPKVRVFYHIRIAIPGADSVRLNVPQEVETAIVRQAAAARGRERTRTMRRLRRSGSGAISLTSIRR